MINCRKTRPVNAFVVHGILKERSKVSPRLHPSKNIQKNAKEKKIALRKKTTRAGVSIQITSEAMV